MARQQSDQFRKEARMSLRDAESRRLCADGEASSRRGVKPEFDERLADEIHRQT